MRAPSSPVIAKFSDSAYAESFFVHHSSAKTTLPPKKTHLTKQPAKNYSSKPKSQKLPTAAQSRATDEASVRKAQRLFFIRLAEMSGKLAGAFLIPALFGIFLDKKLATDNLLAITGIVVGIVCSAFVIKHMVNKLNEETKTT